VDIGVVIFFEGKKLLKELLAQEERMDAKEKQWFFQPRFGSGLDLTALSWRCWPLTSVCFIAMRTQSP